MSISFLEKSKQKGEDGQTQSNVTQLQKSFKHFA